MRRPLLLTLGAVLLAAMITVAVLVSITTESGNHNSTLGDGLTFHSVWFGAFGRKQSMSIKSVLATQRAILSAPDSRVVLWLGDGDDVPSRGTNLWLDQLRELGVTILHYDPHSEAAGTPMESHHDILDSAGWPSRKADWARLLILLNHGGLYHDLDCVFLRDMRPILEDVRYREFAYEWATRPGKLNNALLRLRANSTVARAIVATAARQRTPSAISGLSALTTRGRPRGLGVVPYGLFDFCWLDMDLCPRMDFSWLFRNLRTGNGRLARRAEAGLAGSYVYHWHNVWEHTIEHNSTFELLENRFNALLGISNPVVSEV